MIPFTIFLDQSSGGDAVKRPLYEKIYQYIASEIKAGRLKADERLPSKQALAAHLKVSKTTVETAYSNLLAEGYLYSKPKSGYYVNHIEQISLKPSITGQTHEAFQEHNQPQAPQQDLIKFRFSTNAVDTSSFPFSSWARLTREIMVQHPELLNIGDNMGDEPLRAALAKYLHEFRGVIVNQDQLVIGAGVEYLLDMICQLLGRSRTFAIENPGYRKAYRMIRNHSIQVYPIPVDEQGMSVRMLSQTDADVAYVTPSHQFPTGCTMPVGRRMELLNWVQAKANRYLIEDDYDSEFRYNGRPIPALQGLCDAGQRVIYLGTFSRSLAPSIRIAYMVLPPDLLAAYRQSFYDFRCTVSRFEQHALGRLIESGQYTRHLNRMRLIYRSRRDCLISCIKQEFPGEKYKISGESAGLHFCIQLDNGMQEEELVQQAKRCGVLVSGMQEHYLFPFPTDPTAPTVLLGYCGLDEQQIHTASALLKAAWFQ